MKNLVPLLLLLAPLWPADAQQALEGCYALTWQDTSWAAVLPDSVRLVATRDTANRYLVYPLRKGGELSPTWRAVASSWWRPVAPSSLRLVFFGVDSGWEVVLKVSGESASGTATSSDPPGRMHVSARRIKCPPGGA